MEIKLFGRSLFQVKKETGLYIFNTASEQIKTSKFLPNFFTRSNGGGSNPMEGYIAISQVTSNVSSLVGAKVKARVEAKKEEAKKFTPKEVYSLKMLHDQEFVLNTDPVYVDEQLEIFKTKLELIKSAEFDMNHGTNQIASIIIRLENRKKYPEVHEFFDQFPYTTTAKIEELLKNHDYLQIGNVEEFVADLPKEAIQTMKDYNNNTNKICGKKAIFYIIADKVDFEKRSVRRDPILLAQSPFGHVWSICGAWDKEMIFVDEL